MAPTNTLKSKLLIKAKARILNCVSDNQNIIIKNKNEIIDFF